ncbi:MAG: hypothetical protein RL153_360 [Verrucomicrobiota bacterium]
MGGPQLSQLGGGPRIGEEAVQEGVVPRLVPVVAQEPDKSGADPDPVPEEATGQEAPEFMHARVVHPAWRACHGGRWMAKAESCGAVTPTP